jgi:hypothetical protein
MGTGGYRAWGPTSEKGVEQGDFPLVFLGCDPFSSGADQGNDQKQSASRRRSSMRKQTRRPFPFRIPGTLCSTHPRQFQPVPSGAARCHGHKSHIASVTPPCRVMSIIAPRMCAHVRHPRNAPVTQVVGLISE